MSYYPHFVDDTNDDYHLLSWSPCIDAGDPASPFVEEPEPNGGRINMGAFGNTPEATTKSLDIDLDGLPDEWEMQFCMQLDEGSIGDADGDGVANIDEYHMGLRPMAPQSTWHADTSVASSGDGMAWERAFKTIQEGIGAASDGDTVIVAKGTYKENIDFKGKNIIVRSRDPLDPNTVAATIIDGNHSGAVVTFSGTEVETCLLTGFTIQNGKASNGGGICSGTGMWYEHTHATIRNNVITGNSADDGGGGLAFCDGPVHITPSGL